MKASERLLRLEHETLEVMLAVNGKICVAFRDGWVKDGACLIGKAGYGETFEDACEDYLNKLLGKTLILGPNSPTRKEIIIL